MLLFYTLLPCNFLTDGQFPINLSKIQVEKDHAFLEQADIDSLVRRINILNRCADLMEEVKSKKVRKCLSTLLSSLTVKHPLFPIQQYPYRVNSGACVAGYSSLTFSSQTSISSENIRHGSRLSYSTVIS